jgi:hypothetical protein
VGGGTYGVLTSLHYQLHDYPGPLTIVISEAAELASLAIGLNETIVYLLYRQYIEFIHQYLFRPSTIGVSELDSRGCNRYVLPPLWRWYCVFDCSFMGFFLWFVALAPKLPISVQPEPFFVTDRRAKPW